MRILVLITGLVMSLAAGVAHADNSTHEYKLKNGLTLIVQEDHRTPVLVSQVWYGVGSSYESPGITGISHILEHLMFKGTARYPGGEFSRLVSESGGDENAATNYDYTVYYQELTTEKLPLIFELEADRMVNLTLAEADFKKEMEVIKEERRLRIDNNPNSLAYERFAAAAYLSSPYAQPIIGWPADLDNVTIDDVRKWYKTWYAPNNATVVVVGDVNPQQVYALAEKYFGALTPKPLPSIKPHPTVKGLGVRTVAVKAPAKVPYLILGYNTPSLTNIDKRNAWEPYALEVLAGVLGGSNGARLSNTLVREQQIASNAGVSFDLYSRLPGLFLIGATPAEGHTIAQLQAGILKQVQLVQTGLVDEKELNRAKAQLIAKNIYARDSMDYQAELIGGLVVVGLPWQEVDNYAKQVHAVTADQVKAMAQKYLIVDQMTQAVLEPQSLTKDGEESNDTPT